MRNCKCILDKYNKYKCGRRLVVRGKMKYWSCYRDHITYIVANQKVCPLPSASWTRMSILKFGEERVKSKYIHSVVTAISKM